MIYDSLNNANERILPLIQGVMVGIVTNVKDPDNVGRVKLKLPILSEEDETDWVRMTTPMAGKDRGMLFLPEVNDEVLVAFELGDLSRPIVIGSLWSKKDTPPPGKDDQNNVRKIKSRSGHELVFNDKAGDESVTVLTKKGQKIEIADKTETIKVQDANGQNTLTIKGGASGQIELKSGTTKITINGKGEATVESTNKIALKAPQIEVKAQAKLDLAAPIVEVKADGMLTLKGGMVKIN
ncbi:phage baseplate assembly protein V [Paenibacillus sp. TRM 82003]|nr:phage baseplate assembly protein V [Paenibacillus sp. TRM 82003]